MTTDDQNSEFREPELAINRVYTKKGDTGLTRLVGGQKVSKAQLRIETYGTVDELNAFIGAARQTIEEAHQGVDFSDLSHTLLRVQHELFNLGSVLATLPEDVGESMPRIRAAEIEALETSIDTYNEHLPPLRSFVLPGGTRLNVELHQCRTICRRAERILVALHDESAVDEFSIAYLNRLSDALFVWSRWAAVTADVKEVLWEPNKAASAS